MRLTATAGHCVPCRQRTRRPIHGGVYESLNDAFGCSRSMGAPFNDIYHAFIALPMNSVGVYQRIITNGKQKCCVLFTFKWNYRFLKTVLPYLHLSGLKTERLWPTSTSKGSLMRMQSIISSPGAPLRHCGPFWLTNSTRYRAPNKDDSINSERNLWDEIKLTNDIIAATVTRVVHSSRGRVADRIQISISSIARAALERSQRQLQTLLQICFVTLFFFCVCSIINRLLYAVKGRGLVKVELQLVLTCYTM